MNVIYAVRQIPPGPEQQLAMLHAHQPVVQISLSWYGVEVALDVTDMQ